MKVYCCQLNIEWENKKANYKLVERLLEVTVPEAGSLVVLPEMFSTGFSMNVEAITEEESLATTGTFLAQLAKRYRIFTLGGLVTPANDGKGRNEAVIFNPEGDRLARYAKIHPFSLGGELEHYARGTQVICFDWHGLKVAPFVCYDLRFPEVFRTAVAQGAEMFVVIANWPSKREQHWIRLLEARAIENLAYVVGVNRSGADPRHVYPGRTMVIDPHGKILVDAGSSEGIVSAEIDPAVVRTWRQEFPALLDMHWK